MKTTQDLFCIVLLLVFTVLLSSCNRRNRESEIEKIGRLRGEIKEGKWALDFDNNGNPDWWFHKEDTLITHQADLNGDNKTDFVWKISDNRQVWEHFQKLGTFPDHVRIFVMDSMYHHEEIYMDANNDGRMEIKQIFTQQTENAEMYMALLADSVPADNYLDNNYVQLFKIVIQDAYAQSTGPIVHVADASLCKGYPKEYDNADEMILKMFDQAVEKGLKCLKVNNLPMYKMMLMFLTTREISFVCADLNNPPRQKGEHVWGKAELRQKVSDIATIKLDAKVLSSANFEDIDAIIFHELLHFVVGPHRPGWKAETDQIYACQRICFEQKVGEDCGYCKGMSGSPCKTDGVVEFQYRQSTRETGEHFVIENKREQDLRVEYIEDEHAKVTVHHKYVRRYKGEKRTEEYTTMLDTTYETTTAFPFSNYVVMAHNKGRSKLADAIPFVGWQPDPALILYSKTRIWDADWGDSESESHSWPLIFIVSGLGLKDYQVSKNSIYLRKPLEFKPENGGQLEAEGYSMLNIYWTEKD